MNAIIRLPNQAVGEPITNFNKTEFKEDCIIGGETFGWYNGVYIAIKKQ